jgi:hypothetical protein
MNAIDLKNAFEGGNADNFTVLLLRVIAKADVQNKAKLKLGFPLEVKAVEIYQNDCPHSDPPSMYHTENQVDWDKIDEMAHKIVNHSFLKKWSVSSVGRAADLHSACREFESLTDYQK